MQINYILLLLIVCFSAQLRVITAVGFKNVTQEPFRILLNNGILTNYQKKPWKNGVILDYPQEAIDLSNPSIQLWKRILQPDGQYNVMLGAQRQDIFATSWGILQADEKTILFNGKEYSPRDSFANFWFIRPDGTLQPNVPPMAFINETGQALETMGSVVQDKERFSFSPHEGINEVITSPQRVTIDIRYKDGYYFMKPTEQPYWLPIPNNGSIWAIKAGSLLSLPFLVLLRSR
ncbi:hypothetical protein M1466_00690 [Candidatus Dependentiae bacterium]|nr:hypothetical protein [Candidatus Dependentiae bacterium]